MEHSIPNEKARCLHRAFSFLSKNVDGQVKFKHFPRYGS